MTYNVGINVVEVDGAGAPSIVGAAVSVGAFNIVTERGLVNRPTRVTSFQQFVEQFGSFFPGGLGAYLVKGFFDNGGQTAYINRIVSTDTDPTRKAIPASIILKDTKDINTLSLHAGFLGHLEGDPDNPGDSGSWGNNLYAKIEYPSQLDPPIWNRLQIQEVKLATISGTALPGAIDMSDLPPLTVAVDGGNEIVLDFKASDFGNAAEAKLAEICGVINYHPNNSGKLTASASDDNKLVLTSNGIVARQNKGHSSLQVKASNKTLGFETPMSEPTKCTLASISNKSTQFTNVEDLRVGDAICIIDGPVETPTHSAFVKVLSIVRATGEVQWTPEITNVGDYNPYDIKASKAEFNLTIAHEGKEAENVVEIWPGLSMERDLPNYAPTILNDSIKGSRYVIALDKSTSPSGTKTPNPLPFKPFAGGQDGSPTFNDFIGDEAKHTGFYAFDPFDVQLVCCERTDEPIVTSALAYCARRGDCMFIGSIPQTSRGRDVINYGQMFQGKKVYGALYGPYIKIVDPLGIGPNPIKWIPPVGHVMGVYARIETSRGIWKAPAGDEANLLGVLDVDYRLSDAEHTEWVKEGSINGIRVVPRAGVIIDASRTLSTDTRWLYVNVRLLFNYVKSSLKRGTSWVRQEPNRDTLWNAVKHSSVLPFLMGLWRQGAFGTGTPDQVFTVICDATNNPPDQVDQGNFKLEVYFYPSKPAETIIIIVGQQPSGAKATEA